MAGSEELEHSLRSEVESYINGRLSGQQAEILRVQSQLNEALTRLAEQLTGDTGTDASVAVAIAEHLRQAHTTGAEAAQQESARARATSDIALLKAAVDDIDNQRTQADILNALVNRAAAFTPRLAFFVVKNDRVTGWRARGLEGTVGDAAVRELSLALTEPTVLSEVTQTRATWSGAPGAYPGDHQLLQTLGGEPPQRMVAIPLVARDRCVAVLYADSAALEPDTINLEALEMLVRVTGMAVELLAATKRPAPRPSDQRTEPAQTTAGQPAPETQTDAETAQPEAEAQIAAAEPEAEPEAAPAGESAAEPMAAPIAGAPESVQAVPALAQADETTTPPTGEQAFVADAQPTAAPQAEATHDITPFTLPAESAAAPAPATAFTAEPAPASASVAPLGTRRHGADIELPIEVGEEDRRFHNDARRFARLLVSEIKLYNEQKVRDGREQGDLYGRLRDEIDRSRQMYEKRVAPHVATRYDYFHHELVNTLAEGNPDRLGREYPGAQVAA